MLYSNRSATKTSLRDYAGALEDADKVRLFFLVMWDEREADGVWCSVSRLSRRSSRAMRGKELHCMDSDSWRRLCSLSEFSRLHIKG